MEIGARLKALREAQGYTLEQVGEALGVNKATVQRYETGNIDIKRNTAIRLAKCLKCDPAYIMGWTDSKKGYAPEVLATTPDEEQMLGLFRELNDEGQERAITYTDDLVSSGKYIKTPAAGLLQEA